jgi:hypothetical protein
MVIDDTAGKALTGACSRGGTAYLSNFVIRNFHEQWAFAHTRSPRTTAKRT